MILYREGLSFENAAFTSWWAFSSLRSSTHSSVQPFPCIVSSGHRCLYGHLPAPGPLQGTMASADSPSGCPVGVSPGKNALLPACGHVAVAYAAHVAGIPTLLEVGTAFTSTTEPYGFAVLCQLAPSRRPYYAVCRSRWSLPSCGWPVSAALRLCPSARRFPLAFLPPTGYPAEVGFK